MFKKVTTDVKAAVMLIVTEDVAALRGFFRNFMNSIFKSAPKGQDTRRQGDEKLKLQNETKKVEEQEDQYIIVI